MTTEEAALVAYCLADPGDNTPRLALADWYDDNHPDDDRLRARAEWLRLACGKLPRPDGRRVNGERDWLWRNAHRLWPRLFALVADSEPYKSVGLKLPEDRPYQVARCAVSLDGGIVTFGVPVKTDGGRPCNTNVYVNATRGVTKSVAIDFVRARSVAPPVAADEPLAPLRFGSLFSAKVGRLEGTGRQPAMVAKGPFWGRGLAGVWDELEGWDDECRLSGCYLAGRLWSGRIHADPVAVASDQIHAALTRWARKEAGVPHVVLPRVEKPGPPPEKLVVPRRVM